MESPTTEAGRPGDTNTETAQGLPAEDTVSLPPSEPLNRALPRWALNDLSTGVKGSRPDRRKVWGKFLAIAMSARRRGWTEMQFYDEMWAQETRTYPGGHKVYGRWPLMVQLMTSVKGNKLRAHRQIVRAWEFAGDHLDEGTTEQYLAEVIARSYDWDDRLAENLDNLSVTERSVMVYVTSSVIKRNNAKVTCPCREVGAAVGVPRTTANRILRDLARRGFLVLHDRGTHSADPKRWKAAIYSLSDPHSLPHGGRSDETTVGHRELRGSTPMSHSGRTPMSQSAEKSQEETSRAAEFRKAREEAYPLLGPRLDQKKHDTSQVTVQRTRPGPLPALDFQAEMEALLTQGSKSPKPWLRADQPSKTRTQPA